MLDPLELLPDRRIGHVVAADSADAIVVAPAMDGEMWHHPATVSNVERLRSYGYRIVEPESGPLASGQTGQGRLAAGESIVGAVVEAVNGPPVREPDPDA